MVLIDGDLSLAQISSKMLTKIKILEQELKKSNRRLEQSEQLANIGSWELDLILNTSYWSNHTYSIYGISKEQFCNTLEGYLDFIYPEDKGLIIDMYNSPSKGQKQFEYRIVRPNGNIVNVLERLEFIFDEEGRPVFAHGTIQNITEKKRIEQEVQIKQNEIDKIHQRFEILVRESSDLYEIIDADGILKYISESVKKITGYSQDELLGKNIYDLFHGKDLQRLIEMRDYVLANIDKKIQGDLVFNTKDNRKVHLDTIMQNLLDEPSIEGIVINYRDITSRIEMEKKMAYISTHDDLTNLPNRIYFNKMLRKECSNAKKNQANFALMMLHVGGIEYVNHSLGYALGDKLVIEIANRLKETLINGEFISRYSDDHFSVLVSQSMTYEEYERLADKILALFLKSYKIDNYKLDISANIGIVVSDGHVDDIDDLKKQGEVAALRAEREKKNSFKFYSSDLGDQNNREAILRSELHYAIERDQLRVNYQPIVNLNNNMIVGAEALIRWEHPEFGILSPNEFIPIADETGLIIDIGKWVLNRVCIDYCNWIDKGLSDFNLSINYSGIQLLENRFVDNIKEIIDDYGLDYKFLTVEITEHTLLENSKKVTSDIKNLQSLGIKVAVDDFGTGYSSMSMLSQFDIDILKIDRSFVMNAPINKTSAAITKHTINLANELKIKIIAEGIENLDQLFYLKDLDCHLGQGYLYSKPLSLKDFENLLRENMVMFS